MPDLPSSDRPDQTGATPEWFDQYDEIATIVPGAQAGTVGSTGWVRPVREPLTLYRCLRCFGVIAEADRAAHQAAVHSR